jgi:hypothetical protein
MKSGRRIEHAAVLVGLALLVLGTSGCSVFRLADYDGFGKWLIGPPGFDKAVSGKKTKAGILGKRPWIYGPFRIPEVVLQPAGGLTYPKRWTVTNGSLMDAFAALGEAQSQARSTGYGSATYTRVTKLEDGPDNSLYFDWFDAGAIELIPYRTWASNKGVGYKIGMTLLQPLNTTMNLLMVIVRGPIYVTHDAFKLVTLPVAVVYYASGDSGGEPAKAKKEKAKPKSGDTGAKEAPKPTP